MRFQLAWYALVEFQDQITHAANEASSARRRLYLIDASERHLLEYLDLTAMDTDVRSALGLIRKVKSSVSSQLWANRPPQGGRPAQGWKAWFTIRLAGFWHIITGEQPSTSPDGPFAELVSAAWNSLHPNIPEVKWGHFRSSICKVRKSRRGSLYRIHSRPFRSPNWVCSVPSCHKPGWWQIGFYPTGATAQCMTVSPCAIAH